jgi:hypothetical protein
MAIGHGSLIFIDTALFEKIVLRYSVVITKVIWTEKNFSKYRKFWCNTPLNSA